MTKYKSRIIDNFTDVLSLLYATEIFYAQNGVIYEYDITHKQIGYSITFYLLC